MTLEREPPAGRDWDDDHWLAIGIAVLFTFEMAVIIAILLAVGASLAFAGGLVLLIVAVSAGSLLLVTRLLWTPTQRRFPAQPIGEDAVSRTWQSFAFGRLGRFNHCLRVTVDAHYLHVHPFVIFRWFGARRVSLPWDRMTDVKASFWPGTMNARLDGLHISGPAWAMSLAQA